MTICVLKRILRGKDTYIKIQDTTIKENENKVM